MAIRDPTPSKLLDTATLARSLHFPPACSCAAGVTNEGNRFNKVTLASQPFRFLPSLVCISHCHFLLGSKLPTRSCLTLVWTGLTKQVLQSAKARTVCKGHPRHQNGCGIPGPYQLWRIFKPQLMVQAYQEIPRIAECHW